MNTFEKINDRNQEFWQAQTDLLFKRISDPALYEVAVEEMGSEQRRGVPIYCRKNLETILEDADRARTRFSKLSLDEFARQGGSAPKADALTIFMRRLVAGNPSITESEVLRRVREHYEFTVNDEEIIFLDSGGREKSVPISGLKDRLSRIKKGTNSR